MPPSTILIVDDQAMNRELFSRQVIHLGYAYGVAENGREAWETITLSPPDLVLLDVDMPEMNGLELLKKIKSTPTTNHLPVIMISGIDEMATVVRCIEMGAEDYLVKPPNLVLLEARISAGLEKKRRHDAEMNQLRTIERFNLHLQDCVYERNLQLSNAYLDTLNRLVIAAELKDEDTADHLKRMSRYAALLGEKAGLAAANIKNLLYAAPLHDVGKIGVPDSILRKRGKLTDEEFGIMKTHTTIGDQILGNAEAEVIKLAQIIALTHHEKWDGSGYPNGKARTDIPLIGRIVAIADVFDALTSKRPYKDPYPIEVACQILAQGKGKHFDPDLATLFLDQLAEFVQIKSDIDGPQTVVNFAWSERDRDLQALPSTS